MMATADLVKVEKKKLAGPLTCRLCENLLEEATTIPFCLHSFCKKCIHEKLSDEEVDGCCPVCGTELGCNPLSKLRPDHSLQSLRENFFPTKRRHTNVLEDTHPIIESANKENESSSSSIHSASRGSMGTRSVNERKKLLTNEKLHEKDVNLRDPMSHLIEASISPVLDSRGSSRRDKIVVYETARRTILNPTQYPRDYAPTWVSLVASQDQQEGEPLPQISTGFLRLKDGRKPISILQKYIAKKLNLSSEEEVLLTCYGEPLSPSLLLRDVLDVWLQTSTPANNMIKITAGSSSKDAIMVIDYSRRIIA